MAGYGVLQFLGLDPAKWGDLPFEANRAFSTYGNPDLLGGFLIFSVTVALGLRLPSSDLCWRLVYWVGFGLNGLVPHRRASRAAPGSAAPSPSSCWASSPGGSAPACAASTGSPPGVSAALGVGIIGAASRAPTRS